MRLISRARILHRFSSRSDGSAGLTRCAPKAPASVLCGTLRRPTERNTVRTSDFGDAVENLCIIRARRAIAGPLVLLLAVFGGCDLSEGPDIFEASKQGNAEQVKKLLAKDPSLANARYEGGTYRQQTPLHFASTAEVVKILVGAGALVMAGDGIGRTPLHLAVNKEVAQALIEGGTKVMAENPKGPTPLHLADTAGVAEVLISNGAKVNYHKQYEKPPLYWAILDNKPDVVEVLLKNRAKRRKQLPNDRTMLHHAAYYGRAEVIDVLLRYRSRVNSTDKYGATPLHHAVVQNKLAAAERLMKGGANVNARLKQGTAVFENMRETDAGGKTALGIAKSQEMKELLKRYRASE